VLWAITSFFNPAGYKSRLTNYRLFRSRLNVPLVTVELSFTGKFELQDTDAEILIQISGGDVMWQKERLLNIALGVLPTECDIVAWLDCDVIFSSDDWPERARRALKTSPVVQLFSERCNLVAGAVDDSSGLSPVETKVLGVAYKFATDTLWPEDLCAPGTFLRGRSTSGLAWASSRSLLQKHGFYDARIIGSGDQSIACAAIGRFDRAELAGEMNSQQRKHYRSWADPFFADTGGKLGCVEGRILHLWHGDARDRQYEQRHLNLERFEFDPYKDITLDSNCVWRWSSDKPEMHDYLARYFGSRREDGRTPNDRSEGDKQLNPASP